MEKMKKAAVVLLIIALLLPTFTAYAGVATNLTDNTLELQLPRDGYVLVPTMHGTTGIDILSSFLLKTPYDTSSETPFPTLSIDGHPQPTMTREDASTFRITPTIPLSHNAVYVFRLSRSGHLDITWAFQTTVHFEITSTLPRNQSTGVPVNTGIEVNFSIPGETNISEHFSIYPHVEGRFIHRDNTAVFMPTSPLAHLQIYTVTLSAGVTLSDISEKTTAEQVFSFETQAVPTAPIRHWTARIHFSDLYAEFPSFAAPSVNFWFDYNRNAERPIINMNIYRINDQAEAIAAADRIANAPRWASRPPIDSFVDTSELRRVYSARIDSVQGRRWNETFTLSTTLPPGFYVLYATTDDSSNQMIIQITDLATQVIAGESTALVWVNDMTTGLPVGRANIYDPMDNRTYQLSENGTVLIERDLLTGEYLIITADNGKESVVFIHSSAFQHSRHTGSSTDRYWTALQLDRTLFQRSDTLSFWGFVQNRRQEENITYVTAVITSNAWHHSRDTLYRQNISVEYGAYYGEIRLPHLDPGSYSLTIFHSGMTLSSISFTVQDYVTPPYRLTISANRVAAFLDDEVTFTARTEFFEGTPVANLPLSYRIGGWNLYTSGSGNTTTNFSGTAERAVTVATSSDYAQGQTHLTFDAETTLPEIGRVRRSASVRVFINDIHMRTQATRIEGDASLSVNIHNITLDRLNSGTAAYSGDFLCAPAANHIVEADIYRIYWERVRDGERYDFVTRRVIPRYRYVHREERLEQFTLTTNANGEASIDFQVPNNKNDSYQARITTIDGNGRTIHQDVFIGRDWSSFFRHSNDDEPFLYGARSARDGYDIGDEVELIIMSGVEPVTDGNFLFVVVQDEILSYHIGENPLIFTFSDRHVPNTTVFAYHFNGHTYHTNWQMSQRLHFNSSTRNMIITVETCQESYLPGDISTITITATDLNGNPKVANINISLVDEALFALRNYNVNTLARLYRNINERLRFSLATHNAFARVSIPEEEEEEDEIFYISYEMSYDAAAPAASMAEEDVTENDEETRIRERFDDTAVFKSLRTDADGSATFTFQLPDNITSWRITASGISTDLYAGNSVQNIQVTNPMFLHYTLNRTFLVGDVPYIGVNAFGTSLSGGEQVIFEVWCETAPDDIRTATGTSFERINIPLWEMAVEGQYALVVRATVDNGYSDAVRHAYQVLNSHRNADTAMFYEVTTATVFNVNPQGLTNITFIDHGRGQFLNTLMSMRWHRGARIEGFIVRREATKLIESHFPDIRLFGNTGGFDVQDYQTPSGGIAMLPYADANLQTTVMLMPFIMDEINAHALRSYLRNIMYESSMDNRMLALYGLAMLGEPVLLDLQNYAKVEYLSIRNVAYVALGFIAMGDTLSAFNLYTNRIAPSIQAVAPYYRVNVGTHRRNILDATSVVALLAAQLGMPQSMGLHNYAAKYHTDQLTLNLERLAFIIHQIENFADTPASITYTLFGEEVTRDLSGRRQFTLRIPAENMHEFNIVSVTGDVGAVSIVRIPLEDIEPVENDIIIHRRFFNAGSPVMANTFEQGDIIRVEISIEYPENAVRGSYVITDFLPAGLVLVQNSARFGNRNHTSGYWRHATAEGQRITFFDFNGWFDGVHTYYYYARVINPGTFRAEGTMVQSLGVREYLSIGECAVLTIRG